MPVIVTVWGLAGAVFVSERFAVLDPVAAGENVKEMVQVPAAASDVPQVVVWMKSPGFVPVNIDPESANVEAPILVSVSVWGLLVVPTFWALKVNELADRDNGVFRKIVT